MKGKLLRVLLAAILLTVAFAADARVYLVSVGIGDYSGFPGQISNLRLTVNDARTVADLYSKNTSVDYSLLLNEKATKKRIVKAIDKVFGMAKENDMVVFFFSGHGYPGGFCAYDGKIGYDEVRRAMAKSRCRNKMMFVDACRSGGMRVDETSAQGALTAAKNANVMLFLSSRNNENSIERTDMKNGFFTTYLTKGLGGNADANRNRIITARELYDFVHREVTNVSGGKQHPVMWGNFDNNMAVMKW
ncbi:MAG: caspase family protein [Bacteroidales bacterium]|nr:caspase family protein [Bacteroidales bacterium]MBD5284504.1 caspase family protein [Bacteroides sp.]